MDWRSLAQLANEIKAISESSGKRIMGKLLL
jgi:hypothetical protein